MTDKEKEFLEGVAISAACAALPVRKKEPVAYLYNGVRLPKLPEQEGYAVIAYSNDNLAGGSFARLAISTEPITFKVMDGYARVDKCTTAGTAKVFMWVSEATDIEEFDSYMSIPEGLTANKWCGFDESATGELPFGTPDIVWSNHDIMRLPDILKPEGEVMHYASEPIPIYE